MSQKNKITVNIHGNDYKLISDDPKNYMQSVADYVDTRMNDIAAANKKLSTSMIAVLTALNIADDHFRLIEECDALKAFLAEEEAQQGVVQKQQNFAVEVERNGEDLQAMSDEFKRILDHASKYQAELDSLKDKLRILSFELENKEEALAQSKKIIADLEDKLTNLDN